MKREIEIKAKENDSYKLVLELELNKDDEELLKKRFNLLALSQKLTIVQSEVIETLFGFYWYKNCEINIINNMNKIYSVLRIDNWGNAQSVYEGRIRDCKKSLKTIAEEYKKRGWVVKTYDYTLIIKSNSSDKKQYVYLIHEPEYQYEKQNNSGDCRQGDGSHQVNRNRDNNPTGGIRS